MKWHGGYNLPLTGRPGGEIERLPEPPVLYLPLRTARFQFDQILTADGQTVVEGDVLARDERNHQTPLLAPRGGRVRREAVAGHLVIEDPAPPAPPAAGGAFQAASPDIRRMVLQNMGAWQYLSDARTGRLPDPRIPPQAVLVSAMNLEPFAVRGDVLLREDLEAFTRGLEHIQAILSGQPICVVLPDVRGELARQVREAILGRTWIRLEQAPRLYPFDDFAILARALGLNGPGPVWALRIEGVRAFDQVMTHNRPCVERVIALGGPSVSKPCHLRLPGGYPIGAILSGRLTGEPARVLEGGVFRGRIVDAGVEGLSTESPGLTVLPEARGRRWFSFAQPGWDRRSYSRCFAGSFRRAPARQSTALHGQRRPCIACGLCEEVCPAEIMPHRIHKLLYAQDRERARRTEARRCIECGLCSFVCPSKIELMDEMLDARREVEP